MIVMYGDGASLREVGAVIGVHLETVRKHLKRAGVTVRPPHLTRKSR